MNIHNPSISSSYRYLCMVSIHYTSAKQIFTWRLSSRHPCCLCKNTHTFTIERFVRRSTCLYTSIYSRSWQVHAFVYKTSCREISLTRREIPSYEKDCEEGRHWRLISLYHRYILHAVYWKAAFLPSFLPSSLLLFLLLSPHIHTSTIHEVNSHRMTACKYI